MIGIARAEVLVNGNKQQKDLTQYYDRVILGHKLKDLYCICCSSGYPDPHNHVKTKAQENTTSQHTCINWLLNNIHVHETALNSNPNDEVFVVYPQEACFMVGPVKLPIECVNNNLNFVTGCFKYPKDRYKGINVIPWPEYFFSGAAVGIEEIRDMHSTPPTKIFICQNRRRKESRTALIDALIENGLIIPTGDRYDSEVGFASYIWEGKLLGDADNTNKDHWSSNSYYEKALIDVYAETECSNDIIRFTEKTVRPILTGKPFLILSGVGTHRVLFDHYKFKPYPFLDYSFDDIEDIRERANHIANQLSKISLDEIQRLWKVSRPIAKYNRRRMFDILVDSKPPFDLKDSEVVAEWQARKDVLVTSLIERGIYE